jgi:hypothetical protein
MRRGDAAVAADISASNVTPLIDADNALQVTSEDREHDEGFRTAIQFAPHPTCAAASPASRRI